MCQGIISAKLACRGSELLQLQGFDMDVYDELEITEHQRADLAGNSSLGSMILQSQSRKV